MTESNVPISIEKETGSLISLDDILLIFIDDILQQPGKSYVFSGGTKIEFTNDGFKILDQNDSPVGNPVVLTENQVTSLGTFIPAPQIDPGDISAETLNVSSAIIDLSAFNYGDII